MERRGKPAVSPLVRCGPQGGGSRRWPAVLRALVAAALLLPLVGCNAVGIRQSAGGGVPAPLAARLSLVVAQTRSQFPELSGGAIPYEIRKAPEDAAQPELALRGNGVGVEPGLQTGSRLKIGAALYLDKRAYAQGYLEVTPAGEAAQRWPIVAFERLGAPDKTFEFLYVLSAPGDRLRYLVLIGGRYAEGDEEYRGFEGTLIEPGPGHNLERWQRAYKLDFGYRFPVVPSHQRTVEEAVGLFRELQGDLSGLERLRERIAAADGELASLQVAPAQVTAPQQGAAPPQGAGPPAPLTPEQAVVRERQAADLQQRLLTLRQERDALVDAAEGRFVRYYTLRGQIAEAYQTYTERNAYLWLDASGKQAAYDRWKVVEFHHPRIDELVSAFLGFRENDRGGKVLDARAAAMVRINQHDNWSRDPARAAAARPR